MSDSTADEARKGLMGSVTGKVKQRSGSASNTSSPRNVYRCSDGHYIAVSASIQR